MKFRICENATMNIQKIDFANSVVHQICDADLKSQIMTKLLHLYCKHSQHKCYNFPGPHPKAMEREFFSKFENPYYVCEKTDGVRYIMFCTYFDVMKDNTEKPCCFLINRNKEIYMLKLLLRKQLYANTILDGELVQSSTNQNWYFMIFDTVIFQNEELQEQHFSKRIKKAHAFISSMQYKNDDIFTVKVKKFIKYKPSTFKAYVENIERKIDYKIDGFIFTPELDQVTSGTHENMLKYKSKLDNTVDFEVRYFNKSFGLYLYNKPVKNNYIYTTGDDQLLNEIINSGSSKTVVECEFIEKQHEKLLWKPRKIRYDKQSGNSFYVYNRTIKNLEEDIKITEFF